MTMRSPTEPEILAFIAETEGGVSPGGEGGSIADARASYDAMCARLRSPNPPGTLATDETVPGPACDIPVRWYTRAGRNAAALIVYYHGGGYALGGLDSHDDICADLSNDTGCDVLAVDYRLAPEHIHPAQFDDCLAIWHAVKQQPRPIILAGDSAGGNLAAAVCVAILGEPEQPAGQILIYPEVGGRALDLGSYTQNANAPMLTLDAILGFEKARAGGEPPFSDPTWAPIAASAFRGLPPALIVAAEFDPLRDDGPAYAERLTAAGVEVNCRVEPQMIHGFLRARHRSPGAAASWRAICEAARIFAGPDA